MKHNHMCINNNKCSCEKILFSFQIQIFPPILFRGKLVEDLQQNSRKNGGKTKRSGKRRQCVVSQTKVELFLPSGLLISLFLINKDKYCSKARVRHFYAGMDQKNTCCTLHHKYSTMSNSTLLPSKARIDLPKACKQAWMSSSQLAPLVRCPRGIMDLPGAVWAGLGLWNL